MTLPGLQDQPTFDQPAPPPGLPGLNLTAVDNNLQHASTIESSWGLPALPDDVKLDLATRHPDTSSLGDFLWGVAHDLNGALNPLSAAPAAAEDVLPSTAIPTYDPSSAPLNKLAGAIADVSGFRRPEVVSQDAVLTFKRKAIAQGLLPAGTPLDDRWDPAFNAVRSQMLDNEFQKSVSGARTGSLSIGDVVHMIGEWTDPRTLLHVAEHLDLDPTEHFRHGDVTREIRTWGDKWRHWWKNKTSPHALVDALTGPIDDIVVPAANDLLLLTGVSEVLGVVRGAVAGVEGVEAAETGLRGLYSARAAFQAGQAAGAGAREGSFLANGLRFGAGRLLNAAEVGGAGEKVANAALKTSDAMTAWRNLSGVKVAGTALGAGMRLGVAGTAETKLFPGQSEVRNIEQWKRQPVVTSPLGGAFDLLSLSVLPPHIFAPGTWGQVGRPVRAALDHLNDVVKDTRATVEAARGLANLTEDPAVREALLRNPAAGLTAHLGGDPDKATMFVGWAAHVAAVDNEAVRIADRAVSRETDPTKWKLIYLKVRNSSIAQLRHLDEGDEGSFISTLQEKGAGKTARQFKARLGSDDTRAEALDAMNGLIRDHNEKRFGVTQNLLSQLKPGDIEAHVSRFFKNPDDFDAFLVATDTLRQMTSQEGVLDAPATVVNDAGKTVRNPEAPHYKPAFSENGRMLNLHPDTSMAKLVLSAAEEDPQTIYRTWFQPLNREIAPGVGRFAVARADTVTKQDAVELLSSISLRQNRIKALRFLEDHPELHQQLLDLRQVTHTGDLAGLNDRDLSDALRQWFSTELSPGTNVSTIGDATRSAARALRSAERQGFDITGELANVRGQLEQDLQGTFNDPKWGNWFGIPTSWSPEQKVAELKRMQHVLAAEVEGLPAEHVGAISDLGYKVVHGAEFLMPQDVIDHVRPLAETGRMKMAQYSLGTFVQPTPNRALGRLMSTRLHGELTALVGEDAKTAQLGLEGSGDVGELMRRLWQEIQSRQSNAQEGLDLAAQQGGLINKTLANLESSFVPFGLRDLSKRAIAEAVKGTQFEALPDAPQRIRDAILKSYNVGFRYNGLQSVEDHLRSQGILVDGLKLLSKTTSGGSLKHAVVGGAGFGAAFGGLEGWAKGDDPAEILGDAAKGAVGGAVAGGFYHAARGAVGQTAGRAAGWALPRVEGSNWDRYTRLPQWAVDARNSMRFTLSPFFDLRRYTKGAVIAQLSDLPEDARLPLFNGMRNLAKDFGPEAPDAARAAYNAASRGEYQVVDDVDKAFRAKGILGYSPQDYMAAAHYRLVQQGVSSEKAYETAQKIYAYGTGRSPLDKSINFVFFPFSFEKKVVGASARFLSQDLSRTVVLHDALKAYDVLNDKYDLSKRWEEHFPLLHELQKLNAFQHGLSVGELGGINRPLLDPVMAPIINAFLPHGVQLDDKSSGDKLMSLMKRMVPVYNDVDRMLEDLQEQGHVLMDPSHKTQQAQVDEAYAHWNAFKDDLNRQARAAGYDDGYTQAAKQNPDVKALVENYKAQLERFYPGWLDARAQTVARLTRNEEELKMHVLKAPEDMSPSEQRLAVFYQLDQQLQDQMKQAGFNFRNNPEDIPPDVFSYIRDTASQLAVSDAGFADYYKRFYQKLYGPISREV